MSNVITVTEVKEAGNNFVNAIEEASFQRIELGNILSVLQADKNFLGYTSLKLMCQGLIPKVDYRQALLAINAAKVIEKYPALASAECAWYRVTDIAALVSKNTTSEQVDKAITLANDKKLSTDEFRNAIRAILAPEKKKTGTQFVFTLDAEKAETLKRMLGDTKLSEYMAGLLEEKENKALEIYNGIARRAGKPVATTVQMMNA